MRAVACRVASASNCCAIRRLNGAGNLRRSDSIGNRLQPRPKVPNYGGPKSRNYGCGAVQLRAQSPAAGNGIFGCRDRAPKSPLKCANVGRDQNPRSEWPEIPAETPYSESYRKRAVCEDWMVVCAVVYEPVSAAIPHWNLRQSAVFRFL